MADLQALAGDLHERGIALCVDLVLNHTAREHEWARKAVAGEPGYREMYLVYPDRTEPDAYERTLPEVFPDIAPGSFTEVPGLGWVWTSFHEYQWDLNYANPAVFRAMLGTMLALANRGIDVLRLDAVPFLWKRMGTDCQNQPEAHLLVQAFRALTRLAAPGLLLKAEAIVSPDLLVQYLGAHDRFRPECDLAYDNQLMVMLWSSLATRDVRLAERALSRRRPAPAPTSWVTYVRCHDDIGWAVSDADAGAAGVDGPAHRRFLADFYAGRFPGSFARGALFQDNPADRRRPHLRHGRVAVRHRGRAGGRGSRRAHRRHQAAGVDVRHRLLLRRHPAHLHGRRAGPAQRPGLGRGPGARARQPVDAPAADGLGRGRAAA